MKRLPFSCTLCVLCLPLISQRSAGADEREQVAAVVDGQNIYLGEIRRDVRRAVADQKISKPRAIELAQAALQQAIKRRLVLQYIAKRGQGATPAEIDQELDLVKRKLDEQEITLEDYLQRTELPLAELRFSLAWKIGWERWLQRYATDANLEMYFNRHRRDFDGTQLEVAHILWKAKPTDQAAIAKATQQATLVRQQIVAGDLSFAAAASEYSAAPTKDRGGNVGTISRHQPMPESFNKAAFALQEGEVSPPITSPFGVHLIRCSRVHPGQRTWRDAAAPLRQAVEQYLFDWTEQLQRPRSQVQMTDHLWEAFSWEQPRSE
ncbi:MAG TPA: hypothetical protein DCY79_22435 [Planctomycetaceae bacterium]|nr:hypothetical protein [Planctomycetaceae bacterium]